MSTHPYIPLYVDDYDAATAHLTVEEDGAYSRLIRLCWRTQGCSLPNDEAWIARKIRLSADEFSRVGKPVLDEFFSLSRGRLIQKRLKAEYDTISRKKSARKLAGKKGGETKALNTKGNLASNATVLPADTRALPEPKPEPEPEREVVGVVAGANDPDDWPEGKATDHAAFLAKINHHLDPSKRQGLVTSVGEISRWRTVGYSWDLDVIPAVIAHSAKAGSSLVGTWTYFTPAISRSHADRNRPPEAIELEPRRERTRHPSDKFDRHQSNLERAVAGSEIAARVRALKPEGGF